MFVPRWFLQLMLAVGAVGLGWVAKDAVGASSPPTAEASLPDSGGGLEAATSSSPGPYRSPPPIELTVVIDSGTGVPTVLPTPPSGAESQTDRPEASTDSHRDRRPSGPARYQPRSSASTDTIRRTQPPRSPNRSQTSPAVQAGSWATSDSFTTVGTAATAIGEHIIIAYDDSIVLVGDDARLDANTGDAAQGGVVALDAQGSAFTTSRPPGAYPVGAPGTTPVYVTTGSDSGPLVAGGATVAIRGDGYAPYSPYGYLPGYSSGYVPAGASGYASPMISPLVSFSNGRPVDIAGYEDHSLSVQGLRNVVTYDDSNVFVNRYGKLNANTGDTDSSGLNAVDTVRSTVAAGDHCDDGCDDESIIQARAGVFDEGDVAIDGDGHVVWSPDTAPSAVSDDDSLPGDDGEDTDAVDDESEDGDLSDPAEPAETREEAGSGVTPTSRPSGNSLVIGGDGYDDLAIRVDGQDQIISYDDSNVVIGGFGDVNAQIGDSDTGGTVTMGTVDSQVHGGNSR